MPERNGVSRQTNLERANQRTRRVLDEMGNTVVRHRFMPVTQNGSQVVCKALRFFDDASCADT